jgi:hypothetical protein
MSLDSNDLNSPHGEAYPAPEGRQGCTRRCATLCDLPRLFATLLCNVARLTKIIANDRKTLTSMISIFFVLRASATFRDLPRLSATLCDFGPRLWPRLCEGQVQDRSTEPEGGLFLCQRCERAIITNRCNSAWASTISTSHHRQPRRPSVQCPTSEKAMSPGTTLDQYMFGANLHFELPQVVLAWYQVPLSSNCQAATSRLESLTPIVCRRAALIAVSSCWLSQST